MANKKIALIATMPKSGTWYARLFFWCYSQQLDHARPDLEGMLRERRIHGQSTSAGALGWDALYIGHSVCPGFADLSDPCMEEWQALQYVIEDYNWGETHLRAAGEWDLLNPLLEPHARIIYLYRNPLDQCVSFHRYAMAQVHDVHRAMVRQDGSRFEVSSLQDFIFRFGGLGAYLKQYYTFRQMQRQFPGNVLMVPYEHLTADPARAFHDMLAFLGAPPDTDKKQACFREALAMCSKEALSGLERKMGMSLAYDMKNNHRHIHSGESGRWKSVLSETSLQAVETVFQAFGISLSEFSLVGDPGYQGRQEEISPAARQVCDFYRGQLERCGHSLLSIEKVAATADERALHKVIRELRDERASFLASTSWRLTAPLRRIGAFFRRKILPVFRHNPL